MYKLKNSLAIGILLVLALILAGCSADDLWNDGNKYNLDAAGLGTAGKRLVNEATESIDGFTVNFDSCFKWVAEPFLVNEQGQKLAKLSIPIQTVADEDPASFDGNEKLTAYVRETVSGILKALQSSESDEEIRKALSKPYTGVTAEGPAYKSMGGVISGIFGDDVLTSIGALVSMFNEEAGAGIERVRGYSVPMPISSYDFLILLNKAMDIVIDNVPMIMKLLHFDEMFASVEDSSEDVSKATGTSLLKYIPDGIEADVGQRSYQTVGDKLAFAIIYDVFDALDTIFTEFREQVGDDNLDSFNPAWIVSSTVDQFDRLVSDFYVLGYIYGVHIEYAGFVGNMLKK